MTTVNTSEFRSKKGLTVKDLITTGIFSAIYFILFMVAGMLFAPNPVITFYMPIATGLVCGPVFLLLIAKVPKHGPLIILGVLIGIIMLATGMHWIMGTGFIVLGIVADLIAGIKKFKSIKVNILAYIIFSLPAVGPYISFFMDKQKWASTMLSNGTSQDYINTMVASGPDWLLPVIIGGTIVASLISGFIGKALLKKQFEKAGITA